jgi:ferrous iron transport protein A
LTNELEMSNKKGEKMNREIEANSLKIGQFGKIKKIEGNDALRRKLLDMGLTKGTTLEVVKIAPLGDPVDVKVRGYQLSLRKEEAKAILIEVENA